MPRLAAILAALLLGCSHHPASVGPRPAPGPEVPTQAYYEAGGVVPDATSVERLWREPDSESWRVELPARVHAEVAQVPHAMDPIRIDVLLPRPVGGAPRPLVLIFPVLSNRMLLMREFASSFVRLGYVTAVVPRKDLEFDPYTSVRLAEQELRVLIMRARQALDWLVTQPAVDGERIGVFGISAGGILGLSMMGADARIDAGVFVFAGGPMADVMVDTTEGRFTRKTEAIARERGWDRERIRQTLRSIIRTDPVVLAPRVRREDVLLFIAGDDDSVPTRHQRTLWEALGRPEMHELPAGHYSGVALYLPFLIDRARSFLGRRLGTP